MFLVFRVSRGLSCSLTKDGEGQRRIEKIKSFTVNHDLIDKGVYVSRIDGDVVSYDIRMKKPNAGDYLQPPVAHTIEHLLATYARNSQYAEQIVYVGPMGCRTGFYLLARDSMSKDDVLRLLGDAFEYISCFSGEIPGGKREECGNYLEHDVEGAKAVAEDMIDVLGSWSVEDMSYSS